jgi:small membrane protein
MNTFQWVACPLLGLAVVGELLRVRSAWSRPLPWLLRIAVWLAALVAIANPLLVTRFANAIGIGRGADVVLYLFVLAFLTVSFFLYSNQTRLQRQISKLVTHLAVHEAERGRGSRSSPEGGS